MSKYETPSLPPGYYFYVGKEAHKWGGFHYYVSILKRRKFLWDKVVSTKWQVAATEDREEFIRQYLKDAMESLKRRFNRTDFSGCYPPKKL